MATRKHRVTHEETRTVGESGPEDASNPYWDDPEPHPNPALGCIRRGLCCRTNPGWFGPGEAEKAAELRGMSPDDFVKKWLVVDWMEVDGERVHVFAPAKLGRDGKPLEETGKAVSSLYGYLKGRCIFYQGEPKGCGIYGARPVECRKYDCTHNPEENLSHRQIAEMWQSS